MPTMWNGKGYPAVGGDAIPLTTRLMHIASTAVLFHLHAGLDTARFEVTRRAGTYLDPALVDVFSPEILDGIEDLDAYDAVLDAEPDPVRMIDRPEVEVVARTFGDLVDLEDSVAAGALLGGRRPRLRRGPGAGRRGSERPADRRAPA